MKNAYCELSEKQIHALPQRFKGFLLSPFQFNLRNEYVRVPEDTFKEMIAIIAEYAGKAAQPQEAGQARDWMLMETAPKDGTMLRLLVQFDENATEDSAEPCPTIGANSFVHSGEDVWQFAGWNWEQDCFDEGVGTPVGWLPLLDVQAAPSVPDEWRCFHCGESFTDAEQAALHFGPTQRHEPGCQVSVEQLRELERDLERYREEDTDLHRQIYGMQAQHHTALQREEEKGYARGLRDAAAPSVSADADWRMFGAKVLQQAREYMGDVDGGDIQDWAVEAGLLIEHEATESCGEGCRCVEYGDFPHQCYRYSDEASAAIDAIAAAPKEPTT